MMFYRKVSATSNGIADSDGKRVLHGVLQFSRDDSEELIVFRKIRELLSNADLAQDYEISSDIAVRILPVSLPSAEEFLEVIIPIEKKITEVKSE